MPPAKLAKSKSRSRVVKSFVASTSDARGGLGDVVTAWLKEQDQLGSWVGEPEIRTLLSSDETHHCLAIVVIGTFESQERSA